MYKTIGIGFVEDTPELFPPLEHHYIDFKMHDRQKSTAFGKDVSHYPRGTLSFSILLPKQRIRELEESRLL